MITLRPIAVPALLAASIALSGCFPRSDLTGSLPEPAFTVSEQVSEIPVRELNNLSDVEREAARAAIRGGNGTARVEIALPDGVTVSDDVVGSLARTLALAPFAIAIAHDAGVTTPAIRVRSVTAAPYDCGGLYESSPTTFADSRPSMAFGCATYGNLGRMINDPRHLLDPAQNRTVNAGTASDAAARHRTGTVTPLRQTGTTVSVEQSGAGTTPGQ